MRLTSQQIETIRHAAESRTEHAGSALSLRVDDNKRGGDIDLLVRPSEADQPLVRKIRFLALLERQLGERKIDVVIESPNDPVPSFRLPMQPESNYEPTREMLALQQVVATCRTHHQALAEALEDPRQRALNAAELERLSKEDRRLLDQFAYRYTRLQDDMGARLMPAALRAMGEEITSMPMLDRLNRLEQLGWLPSADEWTTLRRIRNEFTHDYPETTTERFVGCNSCWPRHAGSWKS